MGVRVGVGVGVGAGRVGQDERMCGICLHHKAAKWQREGKEMAGGGGGEGLLDLRKIDAHN